MSGHSAAAAITMTTTFDFLLTGQFLQQVRPGFPEVYFRQLEQVETFYMLTAVPVTPPKVLHSIEKSSFTSAVLLCIKDMIHK